MRSLASLSLLFNALVWGVSWWPLRYLQSHGLHPVWATMLFFSLGVLLLGGWRPAVLPALFRQPALMGLALVSGFTNATFNWGVSTGDVVRVVLLFYLMPLWAALLARWLLHEPITRVAVLRMGLALSGAILVLKPEGQGWPHFAGLPDLLGLVGGMGFALTNVLLRRQAHLPSAERAFAMFFGCTALPGLLGGFLYWQGVVPAWPALEGAWVIPVVALGGLFFMANLALQYGASHLPVQVTSVLMLTEVLFASASSVWAGDAQLTPTVVAGAVLILSATLLAARDDA
ncbi:MAG: DMT family transporter [Acidobacteriota bacterium]